jgi:hypothetical protein
MRGLHCCASGVIHQSWSAVWINCMPCVWQLLGRHYCRGCGEVYAWVREQVCMLRRSVTSLHDAGGLLRPMLRQAQHSAGPCSMHAQKPLQKRRMHGTAAALSSLLSVLTGRRCSQGCCARCHPLIVCCPSQMQLARPLAFERLKHQREQKLGLLSINAQTPPRRRCYSLVRSMLVTATLWTMAWEPSAAAIIVSSQRMPIYIFTEC